MRKGFGGTVTHLRMGLTAITKESATYLKNVTKLFLIMRDVSPTHFIVSGEIFHVSNKTNGQKFAEEVIHENHCINGRTADDQ